MVFCPSCGLENEDSANFCINCSFSLSKVIKMNTNYEKGEGNFLSSKMKLQIALIGLSTSILTLLFPWLVSLFHSNSQSFQNFVLLTQFLNSLYALPYLFLYFLLFHLMKNEIRRNKVFNSFQYDLTGFSITVTLYLTLGIIVSIVGYTLLQFIFSGFPSSFLVFSDFLSILISLGLLFIQMIFGPVLIVPFMIMLFTFSYHGLLQVK